MPNTHLRHGRVVLVLAVVLSGAAAWFLRLPATLPARLADTDCRHLALHDAATGNPIVGIEDIARHGDSLFLSAHDRLAAAAAVGDSAGPSPVGALYRLPVVELDAPGPLQLQNQADGPPAAALLPHGIDAEGGRLLVVDRRYTAAGARGKQLVLFAIEEDGLTFVRRIRHPELCAANDVLLDGDTALVTLDAADCPGLSVREAVFAPASGSVLRFGLRGSAGDDAATIERRGLVFANGIARVRNGSDAAASLAVAETRAGRISFGDGRVITVPGGPDNLTLAPDGALIVALHPSLLRLGLYLHGWKETASSRIARVVPGTGSAEILFDDPAGVILPGVTVALLTERRLVAGSVRGPGLMVCERIQAANQ